MAIKSRPVEGASQRQTRPRSNLLWGTPNPESTIGRPHSGVTYWPPISGSEQKKSKRSMPGRQRVSGRTPCWRLSGVVCVPRCPAPTWPTTRPDLTGYDSSSLAPRGHSAHLRATRSTPSHTSHHDAPSSLHDTHLRHRVNTNK